MRRQFAPGEILRTLDRHGVRYVLIGGFAATIHGSPYVTTDIDITPDRAKDNLARLSAALRELNARIRVEGHPDGLPFDHSAGSLARVDLLNLTTDAGDLDLSFEPAGTGGYPDLRRNAVSVQVLGTTVPVAALVDVIRSKEAAGRPKDLLTLPTLRRLQEEGPQYFAENELLSDGQILVRLVGADISTAPLTIGCRIRAAATTDRWWWVRAVVDLPGQPGRVELRFPEGFDTDVPVPLPPGRYEVEWLRASRGGRWSREETERLITASFTITPQGRFESMPAQQPRG